MFSLYDQLPRYLLGKTQLTLTGIFTALFALVLILVSVPYSNNAWFVLGGSAGFGYTVVFFCLSALVVLVSKTGMYACRTREDFTYMSYILWNMAEIVTIALLYTLLTMEGDKYGILKLQGKPFEVLFFPALGFSTISLGVPCVVCALYFALEDKNNTIRMMNLGDVAGDIEVQPHEQNRITLFDNSGVMKFSIVSSSLYFLESDDNYIKAWYMDSSGALKQYSLRCRLKTVEESFAGSDLVRCHRKYIINVGKISILKAEREGYVADFDLESVPPIPISKTYEQAVLARFNSR